ncbi:hypothetical protein F4677DRAFT_119051 [Hypoxylon crocopeplum]|nr:hypothetical protein F4677DRAFT_119051 [Hypoxylon crocopeplum]
MPSEGFGYIGLKPQCGICGYDMMSDVPFVAILGNGDSTGFRVRTVSSKFISYGHPQKLPGFGWLCRYPRCYNCMDSPEACTLHLDCFKLFMREYQSTQSLDRLWVATAWRYPWRDAPPLRLPMTPTIESAAGPAADMLNSDRLKSFPRELWDMIRKYSESNLFWRYICILDFVAQVSRMPCEALTSVTFSLIDSWERGGQPILTADPKAKPVVRVTIDSFGINKVERLSSYPPYCEVRFDHLVFIIENESLFKDATAQIKNGLLRLLFPELGNGLSIWDTPTPPRLEDCPIAPPRIAGSMCFSTICLKRTTGLTFFVYDDKIHAIHAHTPTLPCAEPTYNSLWDKQDVSWIYIPFSANDKIVAFGIQLEKQDGEYFTTDRPCFLFRTELAGDILVGRYKSNQDFLYTKAPPSTLLYHKAELGTISIISPYSNKDDTSSQSIPYQHPPAGPLPRNMCVSWATLDNVSYVQAFYQDDGYSCRGLLFTYDNGSQRAVGQCRLQVDNCRSYTNPLVLLYSPRASFSSTLPEKALAVKIKFSSEFEHSHGRDGWDCLPMTGTLFFSFSNYEAYINVKPPQARITSA